MINRAFQSHPVYSISCALVTWRALLMPSIMLSLISESPHTTLPFLGPVFFLTSSFFFFCLIKKYIYSSLTSNHILSPCFYPSFSSQSKHFSFHRGFPSLLFHRWSLVAWVSFSIEHFSYYMVIFHKLYPPLDSGMRLMKPMYSWCCYNHHPMFLYLA